MVSHARFCFCSDQPWNTDGGSGTELELEYGLLHYVLQDCIFYVCAGALNLRPEIHPHSELKVLPHDLLQRIRWPRGAMDADALENQNGEVLP